ncbi:serine/arginine-related protein 53 [Tanacetum coccineum]
MEEEKAATYYEELTRKGSGAARFKQGLGFSNDAAVPERASAFPSSSSFLSSFVKASGPSDTSDKQTHIQSIQDKLKKKPRVSNDHRDKDRDHRDRDYRDMDRDRDRGRRRRSRSVSPRQKSDKRRSRNVSPRRKSDKRREDARSDRKSGKERSGRVDYDKLIQGYDKMTPAERVKAKMKLQLSATAKQDEANGMGSGWERFNFDKDAPLDDEEEIEAAEDDGDLMKHIGQTFRFSAVEARREEKVKATHDEAIFGTPSLPPPVDTDSEPEAKNSTKESPEAAPAASLISDQVRSLQQGSWRDRVRKA